MHTQWQGSGREGDQFFDQFYSSQVQFNRNGIWTQTVAQAAAVAGLTVIDMVKGLEPGVWLEAVRLLEKSGGKSGAWKRQPPGS